MKRRSRGAHRSAKNRCNSLIKTAAVNSYHVIETRQSSRRDAIETRYRAKRCITAHPAERRFFAYFTVRIALGLSYYIRGVVKQLTRLTCGRVATGAICYICVPDRKRNMSEIFTVYRSTVVMSKQITVSNIKGLISFVHCVIENIIFVVLRQ
jgi:hypothetical protein